MNTKILFVFLTLLLFTSFASALTIEEINLLDEDKTPIIFFKTDTCPKCAVVDAWWQSIEDNYSQVTMLRIYPTGNDQLINQLYENYSVLTEQRNYVPIIFIGDKYFFGKEEILANLENKINSLNTKEEILDTKVESEEISLLYVLGLAGVDAVNPCELAVLIILMTAILARYPKKKSKALKAGLLFSFAIFIMYFIFGLFLREIFSALTGTLGIAQTAFFLVLAILAIILAVLNLKDAISPGAGGFVMEVPQRWRPKMKALINGTTSPKGAFVVGIIVAFFLTPCTAGPYFVFSGIISQVSLLAALPYLVLYMLIFIAPMLAITFITYFGFAKTENMSDWRERNSPKLHLVAGLLMLAIGIWMLLVSFGIL